MRDDLNSAIVKRKGINIKATVFKILYYLMLTVMALFFIFPYVFMLNRSFMTSVEVIREPINFFPDKIRFDAYITIFNENNYLKNVLITLEIVCFNVIVMPFASSFCAYGFTKLKYPGSSFVFALTLGTMMIPATVIQIPLYVMFVSYLDWGGTILPLTVPSLFGGGAINIFLVMQFMSSIPNELENAAKIDGANAFRRYIQIMMPLCMPVLLFIAVSTFGAQWSDFFGPLVYLEKPKDYTLALAIYYDSIQSNVGQDNAHIRMAAGVFMSILPLLLFVVYQRKLVDGIMVGAIKG